MSIALTQNPSRSFKKVLLVVVAAAVLFAVAGYFVAVSTQTTQTVSAARPGDYSLSEGDRITSYNNDGNPDINVVNDNHLRAYSRNFKSPAICLLYAHYGTGGCFSAGLKQVSAAVKNAFPVSCYYTNGTTNDGKVWYMESTGPDSGSLHHVQVSGDAAVAADADFFLKTFRINTLEQNFYAVGAPYTSMSQVPACMTGETPSTTAVNTGNVSASLASTNPASGTLVKSQAAADLAHFTFSGSGTVTSLKLKRIGVSADSDLTNVYLYDGARRLTDSATVSNGEISFNDTAGLFTVAGSKTISVKADLSSNSGNTVGVQLVMFNGNTVSLTGNLFTVANAALGTVTVTENTDPATNTDLTPADNVIAWRQTITAGTRYAWLKSVQFRVIGSVEEADLKNFRLQLAGAQIGSAVTSKDANGYVVFDFTSNPIKLDTGSRELKVLVDVIGGSGRNFYLSLRQAADIQVTDSQYLQGIVATDGSGSLLSSGGTQTISSGSLTITKRTDSTSGDVIKDGAGVVVARYDLKATGERMKVENLRAYFNESDNNVTELRNGALFVDGTQIGSTQDILETSNGVGYTQYSLGSSLIVEPGTMRILEIRADIADGDGTDDMSANETMTVGLVIGSSNVQRLTTLDYANSEAEDGNQLTIKTGSFTVNKYTGFSNSNVVSPSTNVKVGHFTLIAASAEDINVNTITVDGDSVTGSFIISDLTNAYLKVWSDSGALVHTSATKSTLSSTASNSYSTSFTIPKNKTYQVEVWANVPTGETATHALSLNMDASGINVGSSSTATATEADGQTITVQTGSLTTAAGSQPVAALRADGSLVDANRFTLSPAYDNFTLEEVYVDISSTTASSSGAIASLQLFEGATLIGSATVNASTGSASFTGLNRSLMQADGAKEYTVKAQLATQAGGSPDTYGTVLVRFDGLKYRNSSGSATTTQGLSTSTYGGNDNRVVAAYPTFTNVALAGTPLGTGENVLFKTTVVGNGGTVGLYRIVFDITQGTGTTMNADETTWKLYADGVNISSLGTFTSSSNAFTAGATTGYLAFTFTAEYPVSVAQVIELRGTVTAVGSNYQSIVTKIGNHKTSASDPDGASDKASTLSSTSSSVTWTDRSTVNHSLTTDDWFNDYLLQTINTPQTVFIAQ